MYVQWKKEWTTPAVVGVVSFAAGVGAAHLFYRKKIVDEVNQAVDVMTKLTETAEKETTKLKSFTFDVPRAKELTILEQPASHGIGNINILKPFAEAVNDVVEYPDAPIRPVEQHEVIKDLPEGDRRNIFAGDPEWNMEEEVASRSPDTPYVIHVDEFFNKEKGYHQSTLEYYEADNILCDENNVPIYAPEKVVGRLEWGRGSRDQNVVYVRNDKLSAEYEITRNPGSYQMEVLGLEAEAAAEDDELKHSTSIRRFRDLD